MAAKKDENSVSTLLGVSNLDGETAINIYANPVTHSLRITTSSGVMPTDDIAPRDENRVPVVFGASSSDGTTPVAIGADAVTHGLFTTT